MDELNQGAAVADSPPADVPQADTPPAATQPVNGQPNGAQPDNVPFHKHPRWIERQREIETLRQTNGQLSQRAQQLEERLQALEGRAQQQGGLTPEQEFQFQQAAKQLEDLLARSPSLKPLLDLAKRAPDLLKAPDVAQQLGRARAQERTQQTIATIAQLAKAEGWSLEPDDVHDLAELVARQIVRLDGGQARFQAGDPEVVKEAFDRVKALSGRLGRQQAAQVLDTKNRLNRLPPASNRGGSGGREAPPKLKDGDDPKAFRESLHQRARQMLTG